MEKAKNTKPPGKIALLALSGMLLIGIGFLGSSTGWWAFVIDDGDGVGGGDYISPENPVVPTEPANPIIEEPPLVPPGTIEEPTEEPTDEESTTTTEEPTDEETTTTTEEPTDEISINTMFINVGSSLIVISIIWMIFSKKK